MLEGVDAVEGEEGEALGGEEDVVLVEGAVGEGWLCGGDGEAEGEAERGFVEDFGEGGGRFGGWGDGVEEGYQGVRGGGDGEGCQGRGGRPWHGAHGVCWGAWRGG